MTGSTGGRPVPGTTLLKVARLVFNRHALSTVIQPTISDLQREVADAGSSKLRRLRARWRGYSAFWTLILIAPFVTWPSPAENTAVAVSDAITRLAVVAIVLALLAVVAPLLGAWVAAVMTAGTLVAFAIHAWNARHPSDMPAPIQRPRHSPQINFSSTEVGGNIGGLIFVVGSVFIVALGLPAVIWFLFTGIVAGGVLAWGLVVWHTSHPTYGLPKSRIVLR